jgi:acyl carrier protein
MTEQEILAQLTQIFRQIFDDDSITLNMNTVAGDIEEWDSFNHINIIVAAESHFRVKFKTAETEELKNVGDFVRLIKKKLTLP